MLISQPECASVDSSTISFLGGGAGMREKKAIAVAGATGAQGGGTVRAILADPDSGLTVRAPLEDERMLVLQEKRDVPHFDARGEGNDLFRQAGVATTFLNTTFFFQGFLSMMDPKRAEGGVPTLSPAVRGRQAAGRRGRERHRPHGVCRPQGRRAVHRPDRRPRRRPPDRRPVRARAERRDRRVGALPGGAHEVLRFLGVPAGDEIASMFQYYGDFDQEFTGARAPELLREIAPALKSFDEWLAENAANIQLG
ncbi:hypothetical protein [Streptomyces sp. NPDC127033]|uniref:hypothetical protein n=1 Tax=Streptomyces sp. NPDC127033 TaxID=3347110 RepID=UPI0036621291